MSGRRDRDLELDEIERGMRGDAGTPYIHEPDVRDINDGMLCFLDQTRVCGSTCMSYNTEEVDEEGNLLQGHEKCLVLYNISAQGAAAQMSIVESVTRIAAAQEQVQRELIQKQDEEREKAGGGMPQPPDPFGGKR